MNNEFEIGNFAYLFDAQDNQIKLARILEIYKDDYPNLYFRIEIFDRDGNSITKDRQTDSNKLKLNYDDCLKVQQSFKSSK